MVKGDEEAEDPIFQFAVVDGLRVRYATRGASEGISVLFLHGFGGDLDNWLFNIDAIGERASVVALDLPGHGQSDVKLPGHDLASLARFVVRFMDELQLKRAHLVGHSMGAAVAATMALDTPERVESLTLIDGAGLGEEINSAYIDGFVAASSRRELTPALQMLFADSSLVTRQMTEDVLKYKRLDGVSSLLADLEKACSVAARNGKSLA